MDNIRPVAGGLGFSEGSSRMWSVTRNAVNIIDLSNGHVIKRLSFLDQDRVSSDDVITTKMTEHKLHTHHTPIVGGPREYKTSYIDYKDTITAVTSDELGKKVIIGTMDGRVFIFDSYTFGLLVQLTVEDDDPHFRHQGM